jgi:hypothetical protein
VDRIFGAKAVIDGVRVGGETGKRWIETGCFGFGT